MSDPTPGPYGFNATRETREAVEAEIARQSAQRARRKTDLRVGQTATGRWLHAVPTGTGRSLCGRPMMVLASAFEPERVIACPRCVRAAAAR